jgi:hypothetical protein
MKKIKEKNIKIVKEYKQSDYTFINNNGLQIQSSDIKDSKNNNNMHKNNELNYRSANSINNRNSKNKKKDKLITSSDRTNNMKYRSKMSGGHSMQGHSPVYE